MDLGLALFATDLVSDIRDVAPAAEEAGFESLFVAEHTHIPTSRATAYPMGGELPAEYARTWDPFVALSAAALRSERLRLGTGVCLALQHDPIALAKAVATLDVVSGGRVLFGVGAGWNAEELADHGGDFRRRWDALEERVALLRRVWSTDVASFDGRFDRLSPSWQWPKPVQAVLPMLVGGDGDRAVRLAVSAGGWLPMPRPGRRMAERLRELADAAAAAGVAVPPVTVYLARPDPHVLAHYAESGVARCVLALPTRGDALAAVRDLAPLTRAAR